MPKSGACQSGLQEAISLKGIAESERGAFRSHEQMPRGSFATPLAEQKILGMRKSGGEGKHERSPV
jgi:hypothetical protein